MLLGLGGYTPFEVRNKQDPQEQERQRRSKYKLVGGQAEEDSADRDRPPGDLGCVWDAMKDCARAQIFLDTIQAAFNQVIEAAQKATDLKRNDKDRSLLDKKFQGVLRNFDFVVEDQKISGVSLFAAGKDVDDIEVPIEEAENGRTLTIEVSDLRIPSFNFGRLRIDTIIKTRGTLKKLEQVQAAINKRKEKIGNKDVYLTTQLLKAGAPLVDFKKMVLEEINEEQGVVKRPAAPKEPTQNFDIDSSEPRVLALLHVQKKLARKKGREQALLVNIKV